MTDARLHLSPNAEVVAPAVEFLSAFAGESSLSDDQIARLRSAFSDALALLVQKNSSQNEQLGVEFKSDERGFAVVLQNRGIPLYAQGRGSDHLPATLSKLDEYSLQNHGRNGQSLTLRIERSSDRSADNNAPPADRVVPKGNTRILRADEAPLISRLFHEVYGYNYVHDYVYYPERLERMIGEGQLTSFVTDDENGAVVGHVGLVRRNLAPLIYEPALGVVHPRCAGHGLFKKLFHSTMDAAKEKQMHYCFFDCVTNLSFSQRLVAAHGGIELAMFIGAQSKETQARFSRLGLGQDPEEMDRYSILYGVIPGVDSPFGETIVLPEALGEMLEFLLEPLGVQWTPASRLNRLAPEGSYSARVDAPQKAVHFWMGEPGMQAVHGILKTWSELLHREYQYASVDIPVGRPGIAQAHQTLGTQGFFISGLVPRADDPAKLALRFQATGPTRVDFDHIQVVTPLGQRLLSAVIADYERNTRL